MFWDHTGLWRVFSHRISWWKLMGDSAGSRVLRQTLKNTSEDRSDHPITHVTFTGLCLIHVTFSLWAQRLTSAASAQAQKQTQWSCGWNILMSFCRFTRLLKYASIVLLSTASLNIQRVLWAALRHTGEMGMGLKLWFRTETSHMTPNTEIMLFTRLSVFNIQQTAQLQHNIYIHK